MTLSVQEHSKQRKNSKHHLQRIRMNVTIFEKRGGKNHKLLNIKNINLIKTCLKFFSGSLLPSGENSKLVNMTWGPSHLVSIYWSRLTSFLLLRPQHSFPRASCSFTPFHAAPLLLLFSLEIESRVQAFRKPSLPPTNWASYTSYVSSQSTLGFPMCVSFTLFT